MSAFDRAGVNVVPADAGIVREHIIGQTLASAEECWSLIDSTNTTRTKLFRILDTGVTWIQTGITVASFTTAGVVHNNASGNFFSGPIGTGDIAPGGPNTVLWTDASGPPGVVSWSGDPVIASSLRVRASGTTSVLIRDQVGGSVPAIYMGNVTASATNYAISLSVSGNSLLLNGPVSNVGFLAAGNQIALMQQTGSNELRFNFDLPAFIGVLSASLNVHSVDLTVQPQGPNGSSNLANGSPGNFVVNIPAAVSAAPEGFAKIAWNASTKVQFGVTSPASTASYLFMGTATPVFPGGPGVGNYVLQGGGSTSVDLNADTGKQINFNIANNVRWSVLDDRLQASSGQAAEIRHNARTLDDVVFDFKFTSQAPFSASSPGVNSNSGTFIFNVPAARTGGASGTHNFQFAGTNAFSIDSTTQLTFFGLRTFTTGAGAPGGTPAEGALYMRTGAAVGDLLVGVNGVWVSTTAGASGFVPTSRQVIAGAGMTGGGALTADVTLDVIANADGSIVVNANDVQVGVISDAQHGNRGGGSLHPAVTGSAAGFAPVITGASLFLASNGSGTAATWTSISGAGGVPLTRNLTAGAGLTGGGDLSVDRTFDVVANADGSIVVNANDIQVGVISDTQHGNRGGGSLHPAVTNAIAGFAPLITAANRILASTSGTAAVWATLSTLGIVPTTLTLTGTAPIAIDGVHTAVDLSANRTISVSNATTGAVGVVQLAQDLGGTGTAPTVLNLTGVSDIVTHRGTTITTSHTFFLIEQTGDTSGTSRLRLVNHAGQNGAVLENGSLDLVDLRFLGTVNAVSNLRLEGRVGSTFMGVANEWQIGVPGDPTMCITAGGSSGTGVLIRSTQLSFTTTAIINAGSAHPVVFQIGASTLMEVDPDTSGGGIFAFYNNLRTKVAARGASSPITASYSDIVYGSATTTDAVTPGTLIDIDIGSVYGSGGTQMIIIVVTAEAIDTSTNPPTIVAFKKIWTGTLTVGGGGGLFASGVASEIDNGGGGAGNVGAFTTEQLTLTTLPFTTRFQALVGGAAGVTYKWMGKAQVEVGQV